MTEYTGKDLSDPDDRPPAISGMARILHSALTELEEEEEYIAGLWKTDFIGGLLWYVRPQLSRKPIARDRSRVGPSWSWGAQNLPVGFMEPGEANPRKEVQCILLDSKIVLHGKDIFS